MPTIPSRDLGLDGAGFLPGPSHAAPVDCCSSADPSQVLREVFGYGAFRGPQQEIVAHVVAGGSALVLMPTGGGNPCVTKFRRSAALAWRWWCRP